MKSVGLILCLFISVKMFSQNKLRSVDELINKQDPGWVLVKDWIDSAKNKVEVLPCDTAKAKDALFKTQVTTRSPLGAIIYSTGGLLIDNGWIQILGSGSEKLNRTVPDWNKGKSFQEYGEQVSFLLIADDAIGGFFAINNGQFGKDLGKIYYMSPDNLEWEALDLTYTNFLNFCFNGNLDEFYHGYRWQNWKEEVSKLDGDKVYNFVPPLFTKEGKDFNKNSRKQLSIDEQYSLNMDFRKQLGLE